MQLSALAALALALATSALAAPALRQAGPSGTLVLPQGGADWDQGGFDLGHVVYQGVDQDYSTGDITHVKTHHIDIYLEAQDGSGTTTYLAKGIAPNSDNVVDEQFQIPFGYGSPELGSYRLVIVETQEGTTPGYPEAITFQAAAPLITISGSPTP
ncbi:hypothetical protein CALVIDRAFT_566002 [Calocera viscosa TUFC12733]|uniref:Uncharacterized protein n=1 Tax=Calocera viscosa (strain TUFC12733) TaxID=1330018 RepID=A0A167JXF2_CALVF|nr:hypothetical protein CALVIDRAFT_566002 [Calocera viscosa TUFC12733]